MIFVMRLMLDTCRYILKTMPNFFQGTVTKIVD